jgi:hypothetical protein
VISRSCRQAAAELAALGNRAPHPSPLAIIVTGNDQDTTVPLGARVACNCFHEGKTPRPPHPDLLFVDPNGEVDLNIVVPESGDDDAWRDYCKEYDDLEQWQKSACPHPDMFYARVGVANWPGYRLFQQAQAQVGWEHFPVLREQLPTSDSGTTSALAAVGALQELHGFVGMSAIGTNTFLIDSDTAEVLAEHVEGDSGVFLLAIPGLEVGVDHHGLFIRGPDLPHPEHFRSQRFLQTLLDPQFTRRTGKGPARYTDLETDHAYVCDVVACKKQVPWPDGRLRDDEGQLRWECSSRLHTECEPIRALDYSYAVEPLIEVLTASVATGNPVIWC